MTFEPTEIALFFGGILVAAGGAVTASGRLPLAAQPAARRGLANDLLVLAVAGSALALAAVALGFGWRRLDWPVAVVAGGLAILAAPPVLQLAPRRLAEGKGGLAGQVLLAAATILLLSA